jgi:uncharacterized protein
MAVGRSTTSRGPEFWRIARGDARVFLFGFGDAKDRSWFLPSIQHAFQESSELWLEVGVASGLDGDAAAKQAAADRLDKLGHESGRTLFDALEPSVRERLFAYMAELNIDRQSVEALRPWRAYYTIVGAFWSQRKMTHTPLNVDAELTKMAKGEGKAIDYELPTRASFVEFMAGMSDKAQSQYIEWLLDYLDDYKSGVNNDDASFSWVTGEREMALRSLDRMRIRMPDLYQAMQVQRNGWWARKIDDLLNAGGVRFVAVGQLHVLGPDGIPKQLERMGIKADDLITAP